MSDSVWHHTPERDGAGHPNIKPKTHGGRSSLRLRRQVLPTSRPCALLPRLPSPCCFLQQPPTPHFGFVTHPGCAALRALLFLLYVPPGHEPSGCFEKPPVPLVRLLCCMDPQAVSGTVSPLNSRGESPVEPSVDRKTASSSLSQLFGGLPGPGFFPWAICANTTRLGGRPLNPNPVLLYHSPGEEKPPFPDGRLDALAFRLLEGLGIREVVVVRTTLDAKGSQEDFEVRLSELVILSREEGPRHTLAQQGLNHLGLLQQADLQAELGDRHIV